MDRRSWITGAISVVALCTAAAALVVEHRKPADQAGPAATAPTTGYAMAPSLPSERREDLVADASDDGAYRLIDDPSWEAGIHLGVVADAATGCQYIAAWGDGHRLTPRMEIRRGTVAQRCLGAKGRPRADADFAFSDGSRIEGMAFVTVRDLATGCEYVLSHGDGVEIQPRLTQASGVSRQRCTTADIRRNPVGASSGKRRGSA